MILHLLRPIKNSVTFNRCCCQNSTNIFLQKHQYRTVPYKITQLTTTNYPYNLHHQLRTRINSSGNIYLLRFNRERDSGNIISRTFSSNSPDDKKSSLNDIRNIINSDSEEETLDSSVNKTIHPQQQITLYRKARRIVDIFLVGCKALLKDVRIALRTRRKLGLYHAQDYDRLTRQELRHLRQTRQDVVKTFPVALLFMIPLIGYTAPLMAYFYPRQLLSQQFWHPDQKKEFVLEEYEKRSQYYLPLVKEVGITAKEIQNKELLNFCLRTLGGTHPENQELLHYKEIFSNHDDLNLIGMPRYHLIKLCKCWLIPTAWYLPRWFLMSALRKRIKRLHEDDTLILRDGVELMTPECVEQAVHIRGLDEASLCDVSKLHWLKDWIDLSNRVTRKDVSFLAHAAVFKAANFERIRNDCTSSYAH